MKKTFRTIGKVLLPLAVLLYFGACATDEDKNENTTIKGDTIITLPTPNLSAELTSSSQIKLCWDYISGVDSWRLARFIDSDSEDRGTLLPLSLSVDGKGYTYTDSSSELIDGVRYRYELTALTSNGYTEARTLYLKDSAKASVTITYGNLAGAANLLSSYSPVSLTLDGTAKASVSFYPNAQVEYRAILVDSLSSSDKKIIALKNGDTTGTTSWSSSDSVTYNGITKKTLTISGDYEVDKSYYVVFLARFKDTAAFGTDWKYLGTPYGVPNDSISMSKIKTTANIDSSSYSYPATFTVRGTKKAEFSFYPIGDVVYRIGVAKTGEEKYTKLCSTTLKNSDIESLTTAWSPSSSKSTYTGSVKDTVSISGSYDIDTVYYAFVFVKLSGLDSNYSSNYIRIPITSTSTSTYFASDMLTSSEVGGYAIKNPSLSIVNKEKARISFTPISTASYQVGTSSTSSDSVYNYTDVTLPTTSSTSVSTKVAGSYSVTSSSSYYNTNTYYARFKVKFKNDDYFGTSTDWIEASTSSTVSDTLTPAEFITGSLTSEYVTLTVESTKATLTFPVDSNIVYRYAIVDSSDTTKINTVEGATSYSLYSAAENATTKYTPNSIEDKATVTVTGSYSTTKTYEVLLLALESRYSSNSSRYLYYKYVRPNVTAKVGESGGGGSSGETSGISASDFVGKSYLATTAKKDGSSLPSGNTETLSFSDNKNFTMTGSGKYALSGSGTYAVSGTTLSLYITMNNGDTGTLTSTISTDLKTITGSGTIKSSSSTYTISFVFELTSSSSSGGGASSSTTMTSASDIIGKYYLATTAQTDKENLPSGDTETLYFYDKSAQDFKLTGTGKAAVSGGGTYIISGTSITFHTTIEKVPVDMSETYEIIYEDFTGDLTGSISADFKTISVSGTVKSTSSSKKTLLNFVFEYSK